MTGQGGPGRLAELDAMRGLAALSVVMFHYTSRYDVLFGHTTEPLVAWPHGYFGVQLFFGISGFVIFMTLDRTRRSADFVFSRFTRLYPTYWVCLLLTAATMALLSTPDARPVWVVLVNLTMLQGLVRVPDVDGVYWTLFVELCFYGCMLALFILGGLRRIELVLLPWIGLKWLWWLFPSLSYMLGLLLVQRDIPFFALGIVAFLAHGGRRPLSAVVPVAAFALSTILVIDGPAHFLVGALLSVAFLGLVRRRIGWLATPGLVWLGGISYALYLVHERIGWSAIEAAEAAGLNANIAILLAIALVLGLAAAITRLVERPAIRWLRGRYAALTAER